MTAKYVETTAVIKFKWLLTLLVLQFRYGDKPLVI